MLACQTRMSRYVARMFLQEPRLPDAISTREQCRAWTMSGLVFAPRSHWKNLARVVVLLSLARLVFGVGFADDQTGTRPSAISPKTVATNVPLHEVVIKRPAGPPQVATGLTNFQGQPVMASCSSCHTTTKPNLETHSTADLDQFHQGLKYNHGKLSCLSCHNSQNYDTLRLADTRSVEYSDSMTLCSQCHGSQRRDYDRGLHGGMNGYWDLKRGGRTRNTCINCHDPHSPAFPLVMPVLPPRDRIAVPHHQPSTNQSPAAAKTP